MLIRSGMSLGYQGLLVVVLSALCNISKAQEPVLEQWSLSGFGTLGYVSTDDSEAGFVRDLRQTYHAQPERNFGPDSRLGVQVSYRFNPQLELVGQLVASDQVEFNLDHSVDWAFLSYHPVPDVDLRLGRLGVDIFMLSDYRSVGYAYTWVRPISEFYGWIPLYSFDGADASFSHDNAYGHWRLKLLGGESQMTTPVREGGGTYNVEFSPFWGVTLSHEIGAWRTKLSQAHMRYGGDDLSTQLVSQLTMVAGNPFTPASIAQEANALADTLEVHGIDVDYTALGIGYDDTRWISQAEYSYLSCESSAIPQGWRGYISVGRRFGSVTPFVVQAWARPSEGPSEAQNDWNVIGAQALQYGATYAANFARIDQQTRSFGVRWDFANTAAIKVQWDHTRVEAGGWGLWFRPNAPESDSVNVFSAAVDWMF